MSEKRTRTGVRINWADFGVESESIWARVQTHRDQLNATRMGGHPEWDERAAVRNLLLMGLEAAEAIATEAAE